MLRVLRTAEGQIVVRYDRQEKRARRLSCAAPWSCFEQAAKSKGLERALEGGAIPEETYESLKRRRLNRLKRDSVLSLISIAKKAGNDRRRRVSDGDCGKVAKEPYLVIVSVGGVQEHTAKKFRNMCAFYESPHSASMEQKEALGAASRMRIPCIARSDRMTDCASSVIRKLEAALGQRRQ